ncbi:MAG: vitamin K epoxide reductase family protein [Lacisediminihabitans sp.]
MIQPGKRPAGLATFLIFAGSIGLWSAFQLTLDKFAVLLNPNAQLDCNFSIVVQCGGNLASWQGSLFGFPNSLIGLAGFLAPIAVGVGILAGARFARWFWIAFNLGVAGALAFVIWLIIQSIFFIGTLCPWCMLTWSITIPMFWLVTFYNLKTGNIPLPERARSFFAGAYSWVPLITLACYIVVAVLAQVRLDAIHYLV